ncbi:aldehyde dehydrogenase (NADP(+)) [Herbiconiux solani]|uniref:aldehyde dehydrogenase (NADP(+)) n=1 Tax=Herbiconiux solani TaxID=661329 RepID=UPI0009FF1E50|nr:aldehyde dehydrogenase (NADP(+)) [Herbiconiux solani]
MARPAPSSDVVSIDPRTDTVVEEVAPATSDTDVARIAARASAAADSFGRTSRAFRAALLRAVADGLESRRDEIVAVADRETAIGETRLNGELTRSVYQARLFADAIEEGGYLEAAIDHAGPTPMGPGPDLRRMLVPIGPVAVFGSSNFPLAFSVPGGDTVSALAAGCPVVLKAHSSHPATSKLCFDILTGAAATAGAPDGVLGIVFGQAAGAALVADPHIKAVGFTGSLSGGRALLEIIERRPQPIPFYGELSGLNPLVVSPGAAAARTTEIAEGLFTSFTVSAGQLCTKPGVVFLPRDAAGDALRDQVVRLANASDEFTLLNSRIRASFFNISARIAGAPGTRMAAGAGRAVDRIRVAPQLFELQAADLTDTVLEECFGPSTVVVRYSSPAELEAALTRLPPSLTGTIHCTDDELDGFEPVIRYFEANSGRIVFDGFPTGVLVSWAQTHGGPWPATNSLHTSVGVTAVRRFLRPLTWQNAPAAVVPEELQEGYTAIPRRVDGALVPATSTVAATTSADASVAAPSTA